MNGPVGDVGIALRGADFFQTDTNSFSPIKRAIDLVTCLFAAPFALLIGLPIALILKFDGGRVLYAQSRVGANGRPFACLKFRSMVRNADEHLQQMLAADPLAREEWERYQKLSRDPRVTWFGRFLRAYSLDELPQLINVWRGEMSIVGPRPIMIDQIELYGDHFAAYCQMRPGITGLWQVSGRNRQTFAERVRLDAQYANTWSVTGDVLILLRTVPAVLAGKGAM